MIISIKDIHNYINATQPLLLELPDGDDGNTWLDIIGIDIENGTLSLSVQYTDRWNDFYSSAEPFSVHIKDIENWLEANKV